MISSLIAAALLPKTLDEILDAPDLKGAVVGAVVADAKGEVLYERNGSLRLIPASNQKILACAFAMGTLGPNATLKTRFWKTEEGIVVDAPGDPSITLADLKKAAEALGEPAKGRVFARQAFRIGPPPTWEWDDLPFTYAAPICALSFDRSAWTLFAEGGSLVSSPTYLGVEVKRRRMTGQVSASYEPWTQVVTVDGSLPAARTSVGRFAMPNPDAAAARVLGGALQPGAPELPTRAPDYVIESPPVAKLVKDCLEPSDNLFAEHLMLAAADSLAKLPANGTYSAAANAMKSFFVERAGAAPDGLRPVDGSGLSRQNLVSAMTLVKVLAWTDSQPWAAEFREGLAAPGEGTLRNRLQSVKFAGKTGTINAVSSLSGVLYPGESRRLYVSLVMNSAIVPAARLRAIQDLFVVACRNWVDNVEHEESAVDASGDAYARHRRFNVCWLR